jgi:hypothetical protein
MSAVKSTVALPELIFDSLESIAAYKRYVDQTFQDYFARRYGCKICPVDYEMMLMDYYWAHEIIALMHLNCDIPRGTMITCKVTKSLTRLEKVARQSPLLRVVERANAKKPELRCNRQIDAEFFLANRISDHFACLDRTALREIFERISNVEALVRVQVDEETWNRVMSSDDAVDSE